MKTKTIKITVIYASEAVDYLEEHTVAGTIRKLGQKESNLEGMYAHYYLDTEHDVEQLLQALSDMDGWLSYAVTRNGKEI